MITSVCTESIIALFRNIKHIMFSNVPDDFFLAQACSSLRVQLMFVNRKRLWPIKVGRKDATCWWIPFGLLCWETSMPMPRQLFQEWLRISCSSKMAMDLSQMVSGPIHAAEHILDLIFCTGIDVGDLGVERFFAVHLSWAYHFLMCFRLLELRASSGVRDQFRWSGLGVWWIHIVSCWGISVASAALVDH